MENTHSNTFQICPKCHIGYDINNIDFFDHIINCDGRPDIITTRFYTKKKFYKDNKPLVNITIEPSVLERPITR